MEEIQEQPGRDGKSNGRGRLKIFFSYAAGTGKTGAMLRAAHRARKRGVDVTAGCVETHGLEELEDLCDGLEQLPLLESMTQVLEMDLDATLARHPQLVAVDDLGHINSLGCRHARRYQDVEELLMAGIDVYSTMNVTQLESLNDVVEALTGERVARRIPDSVFDNASQVELIDLAPDEYLMRLENHELHVDRPVPKEALIALRELALRRCADRMKLAAEAVRRKSRGVIHPDEHILVCLSPSPSNAKIIRTAARMAHAFRADFTALFVETPDFSDTDGESQERLRTHMHLAQQLEAKVETVYGDDIPFQIAEFARLSGVTRVVIGRSAATRKGPLGKPALADRLIGLAPNLELHVIPDLQPAASAYRAEKVKKAKGAPFSWADVAKSIGILLAVSLLGTVFYEAHLPEANIITLYVLGVLLISVFTSHRIYSFIASAVSVPLVSFLFAEPRFNFRAYDEGYLVTFLVMFLVSFLTGTLAIKLKSNARQSARAAFRTKILFDANQMLQQARGRDEIISAMAFQLTRLLGRCVVVYPADEGGLCTPRTFSAEEEIPPDPEVTSEEERDVAAWVWKNNKPAGADTQTFSGARGFYLPIRVGDRVYGVAGVLADPELPDSFETSIMLSILGESALALENEKNAREKEEAAILARNEQLRANLLRTISHDLRTPLTSISGNASNLLFNSSMFDESTKRQLYSDIYHDSMWLINLVENLLSVTRLDEGRLKLNVNEELLDDVVDEALRHVDRREKGQYIEFRRSEEFLLARMDGRLIVQVIINLVDNAVKYTPAGSHILISTRREEDMAVVSVEDEGEGIPDEDKLHVFDMFYSGANEIADSRRSLGLGLALCKSIVNAHGGTISVTDRAPHGSVFTFSLPIGEVMLHE